MQLSIVANAVYFYYFAALVELHKPWCDKLKTGSRVEWFIRLLNQTMMLAIWEVLHLEAFLFGSYLVLLYVTFMIWDDVTRDVLDIKVKLLERYDFRGLVVSGVLLAYITFYLPSHKDAHFTWVVLGGLTLAYGSIAYGGIKKGVKDIGFNPFSCDLYKRDCLH